MFDTTGLKTEADKHVKASLDYARMVRRPWASWGEYVRVDSLPVVDDIEQRGLKYVGTVRGLPFDRLRTVKDMYYARVASQAWDTVFIYQSIPEELPPLYLAPDGPMARA